MKIFLRNIHLYLGLAAGLVIITCCFTGAVLVFEKELQEAFNHNRYYVKQEKRRLPIEQLTDNVKKRFPASKISSVKIYTHPERSVEISVSLSANNKGSKENAINNKASSERTGIGTSVKKGADKQPGDAKNNNTTFIHKEKKERPETAARGGGRATHTAFINPYNGRLLELYSYRETFFYTMFSLHRWLLGSDSSIGKTITGVATFIFLFILITGIILWWPRNKAILKQRLKLKAGAGWKRLNHDLHIVLGFYTAIFLFIFAFTALAWSFKWFNEGIYKVTNSSMKSPEPPVSEFRGDKKRISYDFAFRAISNKVTDVQYYTLRAPNDSTGIFSVTVLPFRAHESATDNYYIDQYSGTLISALKFSQRNTGQRIRAAFKPVHTGSIFGWPSKIIAFLVCVCGVTFPVTGTIMWINRLKKNKKKKALVKGNLATVEEDDKISYA